MDNEQIQILAAYIRVLEEHSHHGHVKDQMNDEGYKDDEIDEALKALGDEAGIDMGWE